MTRRLPVAPSPSPLEEYATRFNDLFRAGAQREGFCHYPKGLLLPAERNTTLRSRLPTPSQLPGRSVRRRRVCDGSSRSPGGTPKEVNARRLEFLFEGSATAAD